MDMWWGAFAAVIGLLALGVAAMSVAPATQGAFWIAKIAFILATIIAMGGIGIWLAYSEKSPIQPWTIQWTLFVIIAVGIPGGIGVGLLKWVSQVEDKRLVPDKVQLYLGNASTFKYLGATPEERYRIIDPLIPIDVDLDATKFIKFNIGIENGNEGIPLEDVRLHVRFQRSDQLEAVGENSGEGGIWRAEEINEHYWYKFPAPINNEGAHPWNVLSVKFPRPGTYTFRYLIDGKGLPKINRIVQVKVSQNASPATP